MNKTRVAQWLQLSLIWTIVALVPAGRVYLFEPMPMQAWFYIIILVLGLLLIPFFMYWIDLLQRKGLSWLKIVLVQLTISIGISLLFHYAAGESQTGPRKRTSMAELQQMPVVKKATFHLFYGSSYAIFTSLMMLSGLTLLVEYNRQLQQKKNQENELKINLVMSQLKVLQSELQPHFLFNTLHAASSIMELDVKKAQQLLERLSFLIRHYLEIINRHYYTVAEELAFLKEYVIVQELRNNGHIELNTDIPDECMSLEIPVILLQPILENSVKHGWINRKEILRIDLKIELEAGQIIITVQDNGVSDKSTNESGIGIRNLKERLSVLYGVGNFQFNEVTGQGHYSQLILPVRS